MTPQELAVLSLVVAGVVALATVIYAYLAWRLLVETRRAREAQTEPHVVIFIKDGPAGIHFLDLIVQNIGRGPAYDVQFEIRRDFKIDGTQPLSTVNIFKNGLHFLPPGLDHRFFLTSILGVLDRLQEETIEIVARYRNQHGDARQETFILDFRHLGGMTFVGKPPLDQIARSIKRLSEDVHRVVRSSKLQVLASTPEYEEKKYEEWARERQIAQPAAPDPSSDAAPAADSSVPTDTDAGSSA